MQKPNFISVIIPTYNRPQRLTDCLNSIADLNYPSSCFEVIIVDDGGSVELEHVLKRFYSRINLKLYHQENSGPASARNLGSSKAQGDFLAFLDDDCIPQKDWLLVLNQQFLENPTALVGGQTINILDQNIYSTASQLLVEYIYEYSHKSEISSLQTRFFTSNNLALKTEFFRELGGFNEQFPLAAGEDREFCDRWFQNKWPMVYLQDAIVFHKHELSFRAFWVQHFNYGRGAIWFNRARESRGLNSIKPESKEFYSRLFRYPFATGVSYKTIYISFLFFVSQVAHSVGCHWEIKRIL